MAPHPYENPSSLSNFVRCFAIVYSAHSRTTFGRMSVKTRVRAGCIQRLWSYCLSRGCCLCGWMEQGGRQVGSFRAWKNSWAATWKASEVVFGVGWFRSSAVVTSNGATGSVNSGHDSYRARALVPL